MTLYLFTGPTLSAAEAERELDAVVLPPAAQGDIYRAALDRPVAIGIIDGYFERVPSVSHKEILWAMAQGIHVLGAASMGALRAAELAPFGMEGVGAVYEAFASGELDADDEVAVAHARAEDGYRPLSEALVNIRATLRAAEQCRIFQADTRAGLMRIAKELFYPDRCYPLLLARAAEEGLSSDDLMAFREFLPRGRIDRKRLDALALLRTMRERFGVGAEPKRVRYHFEPTDAWEHIRENAARHAFRVDSGARPVDPAIEALRRERGHAAARRAALGRALAIEAAQRENRRPDGVALRLAAEALCRDHGLGGGEELRRWLGEQGVGEIDRFLEDEAHVRWAEALHGPDADRCLADHLRSTGEYATWRARAAVAEGAEESGR